MPDIDRYRIICSVARNDRAPVELVESLADLHWDKIVASFRAGRGRTIEQYIAICLGKHVRSKMSAKTPVRKPDLGDVVSSWQFTPEQWATLEGALTARQAEIVRLVRTHGNTRDAMRNDPRGGSWPNVVQVLRAAISRLRAAGIIK